MILNCGVNGEPRPDHEIFVCHHCGMPVCEAHGWVVPDDDAFATTGWTPPTPGPSVPAQRAVTNPPQPAMHCRECADTHHKRAERRHGWAAPPPVAPPGAVRTP
ncbi:hypothetical protein [Phytohabitans houttuyneae]|uniref:Uncharacterized protein n=1 Tax=Phytohabitans houttuyneae TaxID=1076126 RepID=A0A6V8KM33_9ACTN|nr:hypothetical protein [Phytohabitans houttuyneae]GFJ83491.1 hypothetical protein Phou_076710 [Phytohabitans houttuyneae]